MKIADTKTQNSVPIELCHEERCMKQESISFEDCEQVSNDGKDIIELLTMPAATSIDFEPLKLDKQLFEPADLS